MQSDRDRLQREGGGRRAEEEKEEEEERSGGVRAGQVLQSLVTLLKLAFGLVNEVTPPGAA